MHYQTVYLPADGVGDSFENARAMRSIALSRASMDVA